MQTEVLAVTPQVAAELLKRNTSNRPLSKLTVENYAEAIRRGEWQMNGQPIIIFDDGTLGDGQHRLHAVIKSGIPIMQLVVKGIGKETFTTIDTGHKRGASDVLAMSGMKHTTRLASAARAYLTETKKTYRGGKVSNAQVLDAVNNHPHIAVWTNKLASKAKAYSLFPSSLAGLLAVASERRSIEFYEPFLDALNTGEMLTATSPAFMLRERFMSQHGAKKFAATTQRALMIKALNAYTEDKQIKLLKFGELEEMPKII